MFVNKQQPLASIGEKPTYFATHGLKLNLNLIFDNFSQDKKRLFLYNLQTDTRAVTLNHAGRVER